MNNIRLNKWLRSTFLLTVLLLTGTGTLIHAYEGGPKVELTAEEKEWSKQAPNVKFTGLLDEPQVSKKEKVTIQFKWFHQFQFAGYYAAIEKGFYAEEGLEVELRQRVPGTSHINDVLQGRAQYGVADAGLTLERLQGRPVVLLAQIFQHSPLVFLSREDSGIRAPEELAGKSVMVDVIGHSEIPLIALLLDTFGKLDAVKIQQLRFNPHDLIDGTIDASSAYFTDQPYWYRQRNVAINIINPRDYGIDFYGDNLFTTEQELSGHPERVGKIRRATLKGWRYALENREEIIELILDKYNPQGHSQEHLVYEAKETEKLILPDLIELGSFDPARYQMIAKIYAKVRIAEQTTLDTGFFYQPKTLPKQIGLTTEEKAWLAEHPTYTVSSYPLAPYIMQEGGKVTGYMTELLRMISAKVNLTPRFIYNEVSSEALQGIQTGEVEVSMGRIETPQLSKHVTFSPDTLLLNLAIFAQKGTKSMNSIEALKGKRIASYKGYSMHTLFVKYFPDTQLVLADNAQEMLLLVATGKADAAMQELHSGQYMLSKYLINNLEVKGFAKFEGGEPLYGHSYLVHKSFPLLQSILDKGYQALTEKEKQQLWNKWFSATPKHTDALENQLTANERTWLKENQVLRMGYDIDWLPIEQVDEDGRYVGLSADFFSIIAQRLGITIEPASPTDWASMLGLAKKGKLDLMSAVVQTPQRDKFLDFTHPYLSFPMVIVTREDVTYIREMNNLNGKKVGVVSGYASQDRLTNRHPKIKLMPSQNIREGLLDVVQGNTFAFVGNLATISQIIAREGLSEIKISGETPYKYDLRIGIRKGESVLGSILQKALDSISEEERANIYSRWVNVTYEHKADYTLLWQTLAVVAIVLAAFLYWNRRLAREVKYRHQAEDELRKAHDELEIRVKKRTSELAKANEGLESEIIERVKAEEQVKGSLHEKEILLREVHHRVKNNMQVITSLLRLQAERINDKGYAVMLKESQARIQSMSLIHEKLYQSKDYANIDFKGYVKSLATNLFQSNGVDPNRIKLVLKLEDISLDLETAIPCGLIINELISNSMKYAFPEEREGKISVALSSTDGDEIGLIVADDGVGLPEDMDIEKTETLGLYLVKMLTERQLDGSIDLNRDNGTEYRIRLKKQSYKQRI